MGKAEGNNFKVLTKFSIREVREAVRKNKMLYKSGTFEKPERAFGIRTGEI